MLYEGGLRTMDGESNRKKYWWLVAEGILGKPGICYDVHFKLEESALNSPVATFRQLSLGHFW